MPVFAANPGIIHVVKSYAATPTPSKMQKCLQIIPPQHPARPNITLLSCALPPRAHASSPLRDCLGVPCTSEDVFTLILILRVKQDLILTILLVTAMARLSPAHSILRVHARISVRPSTLLGPVLPRPVSHHPFRLKDELPNFVLLACLLRVNILPSQLSR